MNLVTVNRLIRNGVTNFVRNIWLSIAATSIMAITLFIISTIIVLYTLTTLSIDNIKDKVGISAYFNNQVTDLEIQNVKQELEAMAGVKQIEFIPKTVAKEKFIATHKDEPLLLETINEFRDSENPLPNSFAIKAYDLTDYSGITSTLKSERFASYFQKIRDNSKVIDRLFKITDAIKKLGLFLVAIFIVVTVMVMFNTIRLTIYNRRDEVEIMRLVGATNWYIRWPFIIEALLYALLASLVVGIVVFALLFLLSNKVGAFLSLQDLGGTLLEALFWKILSVNVLSSVMLGIIASLFAIRRYLRI
ncbi:MAG: ABC transporter permease [Candidatus Doudnabacteria bacterium]|nr:ABC transporter permease [Candidatus Doudnabacteria bacterium]